MSKTRHNATRPGGTNDDPDSRRRVRRPGAALRRVEDHCLPLESARTQELYGQPSAINHLLILNAEPYPGRSTVLLLREAIGF